MPHQLFIGGTFVDAEGTKTYETINPTDGSVSAGPAPASLLPPTVTPPMTYSPPSPHLASGGPSPGGLCLDTKVLQSVSSLPYRNSIEEDMVGRGWWGSRRTLNVFSLLQRLGRKENHSLSLHTSTVIPVSAPPSQIFSNIGKFFPESCVCQTFLTVTCCIMTHTHMRSHACTHLE